jgi:mono/diheme cytochrome c family protein
MDFMARFPLLQMTRSLTFLTAAALALSLGQADAAPTAASVDFARDIRPILEAHCFDCHDAEKAKKALRLDDTSGILKGGDSGEPLFLRGSSADSLIIHRVLAKDEKEMMPPKGDRLSEAEVALLKAWIDSGAKLPGEAEAAEALQIKTDHWSFQPVKRPAVPVRDVSFSRNEIDDFVLAMLKEKSLAPSSQADKRTLIRRLYFVMHGLVPSPEDVEAFVKDRRPEAYAELVEKVLASPRYGERWARHWMDVVRYADTNGFETNRERKSAYHYRDYIIEALNADKPYDQFVREQLAGDALNTDAATGFLVAGTYDIVKGDPMLNAMQRQDELADMVSTTSTAFMGLTMGCARCHNHKFDPILQKDYYAMQAVFAGVNHGERPIRKTRGPDQLKETERLRTLVSSKRQDLEAWKQKAAKASGTVLAKQLRPAVTAKHNEEEFTPVDAIGVKFTIMATSNAEPCIDELEVYDEAGNNVALASAGATQLASGTLPGYAIHKLEHINDGLLGNDHSWIANSGRTGWVQINFAKKSRIKRIVWARDRTGRIGDRIATQYKIEAATAVDQWSVVADSESRMPFRSVEKPDAFLVSLTPPDQKDARKLLAEISDLETKISNLSGSQSGWIGTFTQPQKTHRLYRGEPMQPREVVAPDALTVLGSLGLAVDEPEQQRRVKLANWISSPAHPLTGRVMVNRLWHYIFGHGIVDTPSDFGLNGSRPTHPELLDWLADEFVKNGWSIKHMQRLILLSATFQQASAPRAEALRADADGKFLWRYTPRRLEAEAIRDSMLGVSGALDLKMGGPGFYLMDVVEENVMHYFPKEKFSPSEFRRMVYLFRIRQATDSVFGSFDCPDGGQVMAKRTRSNTPLQALNLFNSSFALQQADLLAKRLAQEVGTTPEAQVDRAFALCYSRTPDAWERNESIQQIQQHGLPSFCRALYNTSEFLFVF